MPDTKLSDLVEVVGMNSADNLYVEKDGLSKRVSKGQFETLLTIAISQLKDLTATVDELNVLDGILSDVDELNTLQGAESNIQDQIDSKAPIDSPEFTNVPTAPTAPGGTNTKQLATTEFVISEGLSSDLPGQSGANGKYVTSDGTTAKWKGFCEYEAKSASFTCVHSESYLVSASSALTATLPASPSVGDWVTFKTYVDAGITITIGRNGSKIESLDEDMEVTDDLPFTLFYADTTRGWVIV